MILKLITDKGNTVREVVKAPATTPSVYVRQPDPTDREIKDALELAHNNNFVIGVKVKRKGQSYTGQKIVGDYINPPEGMTVAANVKPYYTKGIRLAANVAALYIKSDSSTGYPILYSMDELELEL